VSLIIDIKREDKRFQHLHTFEKAKERHRTTEEPNELQFHF